MANKIITSLKAWFGARSDGQGDPAGTRPVVIAGFVVIVLFFGIFGAWAFLAPLDSAAIALGTVSVETNRKTVAHLEGGIVKDILVTEGDRVEPDQVLIRLDDTQPRASRDLLAGRYAEALALKARLIAERDGADDILLDGEGATGSASDAFLKAAESQKSILASRRASQAEREGILRQRIAQLREEITGLEGEISSEERQIELLNLEITDVRKLVDDGLARRPRLLALERGLEDVTGSISRNRAAVARTGQAIGETELRINEQQTTYQNEVLEELQGTQIDLSDLTERLLAAEAIFARTKIRSTLEGTVVDLRVHTAGGVIRPGEPLLDIVPRNDRLVIDARINPQDIDVVAPGLPAHIRLTALSRRNDVPLSGSLTSISADLLQDEQTGQVYYLGRVELDSGQEEILQNLTLYPGMQAEVMIVTGDNRPIDYLLRPITRSLRRAMRDN